jgi:putative endonuclease
VRDRRRTERAGRRAEDLAVWLLRLKGYRILARRCRTPAGEIDIIARRRRTLAFVEVKQRGDLRSALESVSPRQQRRIVAAAAGFVSTRPLFAAFCLRFDVILVRKFWQLRHIPAAFGQETGECRPF